MDSDIRSLNELKNRCFFIPQLMRSNNFSTRDFSNASMPSSTYIELSLPKSGTVLTAPADGYYYLQKMGDLYQFVCFNKFITVNSTNITVLKTLDFPRANNTTATSSIPVSRGDTVELIYTCTGATLDFKFVYTNGDVIS